MPLNNCPLFLEKQRRIDELEDEVKSLRAVLGREQRKMEDGFFGSSTPSSKKPFKKATDKREEKPRGARPGHKGHGDGEDRTEDVFPVSETCPECGKLKMEKVIEHRRVVDIALVRPEKISFNLHKRYCPDCRKSFAPQPPGVLPKSLLGNRLIANRYHALSPRCSN
jgi:transposase